MASIRDLKRSITQMSYEDALVVIRRCRDSRRVVKAKSPTAHKTKAKTKRKSVLNPFEVVKTMTDEQKAKLRAELLGE